MVNLQAIRHVEEAERSSSAQRCASAGERIQLHRVGDRVRYISRRAIDHGARSAYNVLDVVVQQQVLCEHCILDGELVVWNSVK